MSEYREIELTRGYKAIVDADMYDYLNQWKWHATPKPNSDKVYARRADYSAGKKTSIAMHRQIMNVIDKSILVDHINHDGLDNRKDNLRLATNSQNAANRRSNKNSSSKYLGVSMFRCTSKGKLYIYWQAYIIKDGIRRNLGTYKTERDAALAYNKVAPELHKEFANLNIVDEA